MEQYYIKKFNTLVPNGYNITLGGLGGGFIGKKHTAETVAKIKESLAKFKEENPDHFETYREKLKASMAKVDMGAVLRNSEKWQAAVREGRVGGSVHKDPNVKNEIYKKVSDSLKRYFQTHEGHTYVNTDAHRNTMAKAVGKKVHKVQNGTIIETYISISDAARKNNLAKSTLSHAIRLNKELAGANWIAVAKETA